MIELFGCEYAPIFKNKEWIIQRPFRDLRAQGTGWLLLSCNELGCFPGVSQDISTWCLRSRPTLWRYGGDKRYGGDDATPVGLEVRALNQRGLFWSLKIQWNLPCKFWACLGTCHSFLLPCFSFLEGTVYLVPVPPVGPITCLVSQAPSWRGILPQGEFYLQSQHIWFRWYL